MYCNKVVSANVTDLLFFSKFGILRFTAPAPSVAKGNNKFENLLMPKQKQIKYFQLP